MKKLFKTLTAVCLATSLVVGCANVSYAAEQTKKAEATVTVTISSKSISMRKTGKAAHPTKTLTATASDGSAIIWSSADEGVATVENGVVTCQEAGSTIITAATASGAKAECQVKIDKSHVDIHDPSIFKDPKNNDYYLVGTNLGMGYSQDMKAWSTAEKTGANIFADGINTIKPLLGYTTGKDMSNVWAGDMVYNPTTKKYMMYVCANPSADYFQRSAICLVTADSPTGPYEYAGMIVCADFSEADFAGGVDKTNICEALGLASTNDIPERYYQKGEVLGYNKNGTIFPKSSTYYMNNYPDCIDPAPFYGEDGNLYLIYGSFSGGGGICMLKLDPKTGLRNTEYNYEYKAGVSDPYFGKRITKKGVIEGPYVLKVPSAKSSTGAYYYLFGSSGNLRASSGGANGYRISMWRSEYPDGGTAGFKDISGTSALSGGGSVIMYNYKFSFMKYAHVTMGGNSGIYDNGKAFIAYHNKFSDGSAAPGTHNVKVRQMAENEDGWLVPLTYEYHGETVGATYAKDKVAGNYEYIKHLPGTAQSMDGGYSANMGKSIALNADGTISGAVNGTWAINGKYITITEGTDVYKGVVTEQYEESGEYSISTFYNKTLVFSAMNSKGVVIWGSKVSKSDEDIVAEGGAELTCPEDIVKDFKVPTKTILGASISWKCSKPNIIKFNADGTAVVAKPDKITPVTITATVSHGTASEDFDFDATVAAFEPDIPGVIKAATTLSLPAKTPQGTSITWGTSNPKVIDAKTGKVTMPSDLTVVMVGAKYGAITKQYSVVVGNATKFIYKQDFEDVADNAELRGVWKSPNAGDQVNLVNDEFMGNYMKYGPVVANGTRGLTADFETADDTSKTFNMEFDAMLETGTDKEAHFVVASSDFACFSDNANYGAEKGYILKMTATNSTRWSIAGTDEIADIPKYNWTHFTLTVKPALQRATVKITKTDDDSVVYFDGSIDTNSEESNLKGIYLLAGRASGCFALDNIRVYDSPAAGGTIVWNTAANGTTNNGTTTGTNTGANGGTTNRPSAGSNNVSLKKATITVKNGKKKVTKVNVKKKKKVTLKVSVDSKASMTMKKLSKKDKKIVIVTFKKGKLTIKGKKKGTVKIKITAKKTAKYKEATKTITVKVK